MKEKVKLVVDSDNRIWQIVTFGDVHPPEGLHVIEIDYRDDIPFDDFNNYKYINGEFVKIED